MLLLLIADGDEMKDLVDREFLCVDRVSNVPVSISSRRHEQDGPLDAVAKEDKVKVADRKLGGRQKAPSLSGSFDEKFEGKLTDDKISYR